MSFPTFVGVPIFHLPDFGTGHFYIIVHIVIISNHPVHRRTMFKFLPDIMLHAPPAQLSVTVNCTVSVLYIFVKLRKKINALGAVNL